MKVKKLLSLLIAAVLCLSSFTAFADGDLLIMPAPTQPSGGITVEYNGVPLTFDVEPIAENGRTLVPFRAIFEVMGCAVDYSIEEDDRQIVTAHRGNENLMLTIGENKMYFTGEEIELDVPAKVKDNRTLVPIRAISEAFECDVLWDGNTKTVSINPPVGHFNISAERISETITDSSGNILIDIVAYYPVIASDDAYPYINEINEEFKWNATLFVDTAKALKEDAEYLRNEMGADNFSPFVFEMTYEETYNVFGILSVTFNKYMYTAGAHPMTVLESFNYNVGSEEELSVSAVIDENVLDDGLGEHITNLFVEKLDELDFEYDIEDVHEYIYEHIGYVQFYLEGNSLFVYFNQGDVFPYAYGVVSVEIPYDPQLFFIDMNSTLLDEYVYEVEYYEGHKWVVTNYSEDKIQVSIENEIYDPETLLSENFPIGMTRVKLKGIAKGNATVSLAHLTEDGEISDQTQVIISKIYIDKNNKINIVTESDDIDLLK